MTDNEIIKELNLRIDNFSREALDLINRQKAEIERLQKDLTKCKLEKETLYHIGKEIKDVAIKDFAHFVIDRSKNGVICTSDIPDLVKEMTEGEK